MKWQVAVLLCCGWISGVFALGDTENSQKVEPGGTGVFNTGSGSVTVGIPPSEYLRVAELLGMTKEKLGVTQKVLDSFLKTLGEKQIPLEKLDSTLTEIAKRYKELLEKVATFTSDDPEVKRLLTEAKMALESGKSDEAEKLYNQASDRDVAAAKQLQEMAEKRLVSAAQAKFANGGLKMTKLAYQEAASYYQQAAELLPAGHEEEKARYMNETGNAFHHAGKYEKALPLLKEASKIFGQVLGKQHPYYAASLNNLAELYRTQGKYEEALPLFQEALKIRERVLGKEHPDYATSLNTLAALYYSQGKYGEALPLFQEALKIEGQVLGKEHPDYALSLNNLAVLYSSQGKHEEALPLYQEALKIRERVLGKEHPDYATSLNSLAVLYYSQGKYDEALPLFQESLKIREQVLGKEHPGYATSLNNLAGLYNSQGRYEEALPLYQESLKIDEKVYGKNHPDVAIDLNNLAGLYRTQGKYEEALPLFQQAVEIQTKVLGEQHPDSQLFAKNLRGVQDHLDGKYQVIVKQVLPDSRAAQLGIQVGDIFTHYDQQPILGRSQFIQGRAKEPADGAAKELTVLRDGKSLTFQLKPGKIGVELEEKLKSEP